MRLFNMYNSVEEVLIQIELGAREKLCTRETYYRHQKMIYNNEKYLAY